MSQTISRRYSASDKMISLIADNYMLIQVLTRFGIRMGFGDKSVAEVCAISGIDCGTFLAVINFVSEGYAHSSDPGSISVASLVQYLRQSHSYFLEYCLPAIRRKLLDGIKLNDSDVSFLIIKFFDEYYNEVKAHMDYEDRNVFTYIDAIASGETPDDYSAATYSDHHSQVAGKLKELKSIIIKYCPESADANLLNAALYDIYRTERELESHCLIEDYLLTPAIMLLEENIKDNRKGTRR